MDVERVVAEVVGLVAKAARRKHGLVGAGSPAARSLPHFASDLEANLWMDWLSGEDQARLREILDLGGDMAKGLRAEVERLVEANARLQKAYEGRKDALVREALRAVDRTVIELVRTEGTSAGKAVQVVTVTRDGDWCHVTTVPAWLLAEAGVSVRDGQSVEAAVVVEDGRMRLARAEVVSESPGLEPGAARAATP